MKTKAAQAKDFAVQQKSVDATNSDSGRWYLLALMTAIYASHAMDRAVTSVIMQPIKQEFQLSDTQLGALGGLTHGIAFCLAVLPIGWLADRVSRRNLLGGLVTIWSGLTFLAGLAQSYWMLLLIRFGVGAAEAGGAPLSMSLIAERFPEKGRAQAVGIFYLGVAIGQGAIFVLGGYVARLLNWRWVYMIAGIPGLLMALLLIMTVRDRRSKTPATRPEAPAVDIPFADVFRFIAGSPATLLLLIAVMAASMANNAIWAWMASLLIRQRDFTIDSAGLLLGLSSGLCGGLGSAVSGAMVSRWAADSMYRMGLAAALVCLIGIPAGFGAIFATDVTVISFCVLALGVILSAWLAPAFAFVLALAPEQIRSSVLAVFQLGATFSAIAVVPVLVGFISDAIGGSSSLPLAMALVFSAEILAAVAFALSALSAARRARI